MPRPDSAFGRTLRKVAGSWPVLTSRWPNFDRYVERSARDLRVLRLERVAP